MHSPTTVCSPARLEEFLRGDLSQQNEQQLTEHLDACESCRIELAAKAAGPSFWRETSELLADGCVVSTPAGQHVSRAVDAPTRSFETDSVLATLAPTDDPLMLGRLGPYEVSGVVGAGGMGVVLKARDQSLDRTVAIKVMAPHLASSGSARARFAREAKAAAAVLHPNVLAIYGVSNGHALPYLVMPYVRGVSLQKRLDREGPLPAHEALRIGSQIAAGLAAAHAQGLVHRDIKPANILLEDGVERVSITDFGLARAVDDATMTRSGVIAGTPQYMSPEQGRGELVDQRSDLFSLGSVLYAICTGRPPFRADSTYGVIRRITDDEPTPIREINPDVPAWFCEIIARLMAKQPCDRYASAREVTELLEECLAHVQQPDMVPLPASLKTPLDDRRFRSNSRRMAGVAATVVVVAAALWGMFLATMGAPPDIAGDWTGDNWGHVVLEQLPSGKYQGAYLATFENLRAHDHIPSVQPWWKGNQNCANCHDVAQLPRGKIDLKWSPLERRFNGTWREGNERFGKISVRLLGDEIRGGWTTNKKSKAHAGAARLGDLLWVRSKEATTRVEANDKRDADKLDNTNNEHGANPKAGNPRVEINESERDTALRDRLRAVAAKQRRDDALRALTGKWRVVEHRFPPRFQTESPDSEEIYTLSPEGFSVQKNGKAAGAGALEVSFQEETPRLTLRFKNESGFTGAHIDGHFEVRPDSDHLWLAIPDTSVRPSEEAVLTGQPRVLWILRRIRATTAPATTAPATSGTTRRGTPQTTPPPQATLHPAPDHPFAHTAEPESTRVYSLEELYAEKPTDVVTVEFRVLSISSSYSQRYAKINQASARPIVLDSTKPTLGEEPDNYFAVVLVNEALSSVANLNPGFFRNKVVRATGFLRREPESWQAGRRVRHEIVVHASKNLEVVAESAVQAPVPESTAPQSKAAKSMPKLAQTSSFSTRSSVRRIACSADGKWLAVANGNPTLVLQTTGASRVKNEWTPTVDILDAESGKLLKTLRLVTEEEQRALAANKRVSHFEVTAFAFSPAGSMLAVGTSIGCVNLYHAESGELIRSLDDEPSRPAIKTTPADWRALPRALGSVTSLAFSPDGKTLAACGRSFAEASERLDSGRRLGRAVSGPGRLKLWDVETGRLRHDLNGHSHVEAVAFSPDGKLLASVGRWSSNREDGAGAILWNPQTAAKIRIVEVPANGGAHAVAFSPDGKQVAIGSRNFDKDNDTSVSCVSLAHVATGVIEWRQTIDGSARPAAFSPDGEHVAALCEDQAIRFLSARTGVLDREIRAADSQHARGWNDLAISRDGGWMAIGGADRKQTGRVEIWRLSDPDASPRRR